MFLPAHFRQRDAHAIAALIDAYPLALLCVSVDNRVETTQVPVVAASSDAEQPLSLLFHLSRNNPVARALCSGSEALMVFTGMNAYISPDWYGTPEQVPTWNYATVQVRGQPVEVDDDGLCTLLDRLSQHSERQFDKTPWTTEKMDASVYAKMRKAIVGFEMVASSVDAKWKMNQNRQPEERRNLRAELQKLDSPAHELVRKEIPE